MRRRSCSVCHVLFNVPVRHPQQRCCSVPCARRLIHQKQLEKTAEKFEQELDKIALHGQRMKRADFVQLLQRVWRRGNRARLERERAQRLTTHSYSG